jgi:hypothetical protein
LADVAKVWALQLQHVRLPKMESASLVENEKWKKSAESAGLTLRKLEI